MRRWTPQVNQTTLAVLAIILGAGVVGMVTGSVGVLAVALPLALIGGMVLVYRPVIGLFLFAAMIPLEGALMIGGRSVAALVGMMVFAAWAVQKLARKEPLAPLVSSRLIQVGILLWALACLSLIWAQDPGRIDRQLVLLLQLILLAVLVVDLASSWERLAWVAKVLVVSATIAALLTLEQYYLGGARRAGAGIVGGLNRTAVTLVTILPFAIYLLRSSEALAWRALGLAYVGLAAIAVAATLSRMNYPMFPLVIGMNVLFMATTRRGRRGVIVLAGMAVLALAFMPTDVVTERARSIVPYISQSVGVEETAETHSPRGYLLHLGWAMFQDRPVLGSGYDGYRPQATIYQWQVSGSPTAFVPEGRSPHSSHLDMLVSLGIVGFLMWSGLFLIALGYVWRTCRGNLQSTSDRIILAQAVGIAVLLQLLYGFYSLIHQDKIVWLILGMAVVVGSLTSNPASSRRMEKSPWTGGALQTKADQPAHAQGKFQSMTRT